jgi:hypothetical protein
VKSMDHSPVSFILISFVSILTAFSPTIFSVSPDKSLTP